MGVRPRWDWTSGRVIGFEVMKVAELRRPRVDVTFRVSGFFRDAFPEQIDLIDSAARAVMALDEPAEDILLPPAIAPRLPPRSIAARMPSGGAPGWLSRFRFEARCLWRGVAGDDRRGLWHHRADLASSISTGAVMPMVAGSRAMPERDRFARRLGQADALVHNQDNREHDLLDSDDYYQFEGGLSAAVEHRVGAKPPRLSQ